MAMTRQEILNCMKALDINVKEICAVALSDVQLQGVYFGLAHSLFKVDHEQDADFVHQMLADFYGMLACPYCRAKLFPNDDESAEPEGIEA